MLRSGVCGSNTHIHTCQFHVGEKLHLPTESFTGVNGLSVFLISRLNTDLFWIYRALPRLATGWGGTTRRCGREVQNKQSEQLVVPSGGAWAAMGTEYSIVTLAGVSLRSYNYVVVAATRSCDSQRLPKRRFCASCHITHN